MDCDYTGNGRSYGKNDTSNNLSFYYSDSFSNFGDTVRSFADKIVSDEDIRFKNYYRDYIDCHEIFILAYPNKNLFCKMKQRIEFKGSCSRKHQRPKKLRGQRLF